jgi:hypothetical protein
MRLLNQIRNPTPALLPLNTGEPERRERRGREREKKRRSPSPVRRKKKARSPSSSSSDSEEASESDYSSYDEPEVIKSRYKKEPCEYVSNAGLADKKTKKEVVNYLEEKACPKIEKHAKRKHVPPPPAVSQPASPVAPVGGGGANPSGGGTPAPPGEDAIVKRGKGRPKGPERIKKPPTAYNIAVGKHMKAGKTMSEAAKLAKEELAKKD